MESESPRVLSVAGSPLACLIRRLSPLGSSLLEPLAEPSVLNPIAMKSRFSSFVLSAALLLPLAPALHATEAPLDLGALTFSINQTAETVQVDLSKSLLKIAARIAAVEDAEAAKLLGGLERVQVRVFTLSDKGDASALSQIEEIRSRLLADGWHQAVSVKGKEGENVGVHLRLRGEELIEGLVVSVLGPKGEVVLVNVVGEVRPEQLAKLGEKLNIQPLKQLDVGSKPDKQS